MILKALVVYMSLTGCTEEMAHYVAKKLGQQNIEVELKHCLQAEPQDFLNYDICVVGTYTYGAHGDLPDEIVDFYFDLEEVDLTGKIYAVFGSCDPIYECYGKSIDDFDKKMNASGAVKGAEVVKVELTANDKDKNNLGEMVHQLIKKAE